jgi:hypothetical protein
MNRQALLGVFMIGLGVALLTGLLAGLPDYVAVGSRGEVVHVKGQPGLLPNVILSRDYPEQGLHIEKLLYKPENNNLEIHLRWNPPDTNPYKILGISWTGTDSQGNTRTMLLKELTPGGFDAVVATPLRLTRLDFYMTAKSGTGGPVIASFTAGELEAGVYPGVEEHWVEVRTLIRGVGYIGGVEVYANGKYLGRTDQQGVLRVDLWSKGFRYGDTITYTARLQGYVFEARKDTFTTGTSLIALFGDPEGQTQTTTTTTTQTTTTSTTVTEQVTQTTITTTTTTVTQGTTITTTITATATLPASPDLVQQALGLAMTAIGAITLIKARREP